MNYVEHVQRTQRVALIDDQNWFAQNPTRLTRCRPAIVGEHPNVPPNARWLAVMRKVTEGAHVRLLTYYVPQPPGDLRDMDFSTEAIASIPYLTLASPRDEDRDAMRARVVAEALRTTPAEGNA